MVKQEKINKNLTFPKSRAKIQWTGNFEKNGYAGRWKIQEISFAASILAPSKQLYSVKICLEKNVLNGVKLHLNKCKHLI